MTKVGRRATIIAISLGLAAAVVGAVYRIDSRSLKPQAAPAPPAIGSPPGAPGGEAPSRWPAAAAIEQSPFRFESMTARSGIDFMYYGAPSPEAYMTEQNGGGVALFDADGDGRLDVFLVNGSHFERPAEAAGAGNRLFRQTGDWRFDDVTAAAGLEAFGFGQGCAAGDYDNDGFCDLFVAGYGTSRLWHNNGDGTYTEVTDAAGVGSERWGCSAAMADLDGDGLLDLYVVNYVEWSSDEPPCHPPGHPQINSVCSPMERSGQADLLYRNLGDGRFAEIGAQAGIARADGKGLALAIADLNGDSRLDIYVANDTTPNFLFHNQGNMQFEEVGVVQGVAISSDGSVGSGMGVACADYDHNGGLDLCVTNFRNQVNDFFANLDQGGFIAVNTRLGLDLASRSPLGFGIVPADFDLDSWPDMFVANGHIWDLTSLGAEYEYQMHPQLLWNRRAQRFTDVSASAGDYFTQRRLGRAVAVGDLDNDGAPDLVVTHLAEPPAVLRNACDRAGGSVRLELIGTRSARQPLGARVTHMTDRQRLVTHVPSGGSFQAGHDPRVLLTTGARQTIPEIQVSWPGGDVETWKDVAVDDRRTLRLIEGTGE